MVNMIRDNLNLLYIQINSLSKEEILKIIERLYFKIELEKKHIIFCDYQMRLLDSYNYYIDNMYADSIKTSLKLINTFQGKLLLYENKLLEMNKNG